MVLLEEKRGREGERRGKEGKEGGEGEKKGVRERERREMGGGLIYLSVEGQVIGFPWVWYQLISSSKNFL